MENSICDRLFADEVIWGLHTTYNCDMAYSAEVLLKQYKETAIGNVADKDGFAVFYNKSCGLKSTSKETDAKWFKDKFFFPLSNNNKQTYHAKISLIKYKDNNGKDGYRIAVYSKNHSFGYGCAEVGEVFNLVPREENNQSINMLGGYLDTIYEGASEEGKRWLENNGLNKDGVNYCDLSNCSVIDENNNPIDLYFGGCSDLSNTLGQYIEMSKVDFKSSVIITPPEFVKASPNCQDFFVNNKCLYDLKLKSDMGCDSSHEKVYLIKKNDGTHHLWFGSANATPHGLGIRFHEKKDENTGEIYKLGDPIPLKEQSIECLVHKKIEEQEYEKIKEQIEANYICFDDFNKPGSLKNDRDSFATDLAQNCEAKAKFFDINGKEITNGAELSLNTAEICLELSATNIDAFEKYIKRIDLFQIIPAEYKWKGKNTPWTASIGEVCLKLFNNQVVTLSIKVDKYQPIKGTAYVNDDVIMDLIIPDCLNACIETNPPTYSITLVSDWLQGKSRPLEQYNDSKLQWFSDLIRTGKTEVKIDNSADRNSNIIASNSNISDELPQNVELKTEQMNFQKYGTSALLTMLENNSRAFLADEAGLGKTYTSTGVMDALYEKFLNENPGRPFYVFYIAPNIPLLSKNCRDIVKKSRYSRDIIDLSNLRLELVIKLAVRHALEVLDDNDADKESLESISEKIYEYLTREISKNKNWNNLYSESAIKKLYKTLSIPSCKTDLRKKVLSKDKLQGIIQGQQLSNIFCKGFKTIDRIAFIDKYLKKNEVLFNKKIVLLPISSQLILDSDSINVLDSGSGYEKKLRERKTREEITNFFLNNYNPNMIIWDEYHRYMKQMDDSKNPFLKWETESHNMDSVIPFKAVYLSATPYLSNKSEVDSNAEKRYDDWNDKESKEKIPEFKDFAKLLAGGYSSIEVTADQIVEKYDHFIEGKTLKTELENIMRKRMVRHERSRLQNNYEQHKLLGRDNYYTDEYAEVLLRTQERMKKMKDAGFKEGTINQALNMPYFGSFMYKNKNAKYIYSVVCEIDREKMDSLLFIPDSLKDLPKEALAIKQLIDTNIKDDMSSMIWIPATNPLYNPGESSIYNTYKRYSKTLIFAETIFYQRGYSYLLSRYVDEVANTCQADMNQLKDQFKLSFADRAGELIEICNPWEFENGTRLDDKMECIINETKKSYMDVLASIAAPAVCAARLGLDASVYEELFNKYFQRPEICKALGHWIEKWISDNSCLIEKLKLQSKEEKYQLALLRYCAEGNLLAVLEEWIFVLNESDPDKLSDRFQQVLEDDTNRHTIVYPVSKKEFVDKNDATVLNKECTFAERLVGDYLDCASGENVEVKKNLSAKFSSPFWPMIMIAGRGAQEGMDYHEYCLRMMHLTLPTGPVSFEQRQGRIDRFRSLMVRRRVGKFCENMQVDCKKDLLRRQYAYLLNNKPKDNELYANYNMPVDGENYFERMLPFWDFSNEAREYHILENRLDSYRSSLGVYKNIDNAMDLSASSFLTAEHND